MPEVRDFNYDAALRRLIELRFSARKHDPRMTDEERRLERDIYNYVLGTTAATVEPQETGKSKVKPAA